MALLPTSALTANNNSRIPDNTTELISAFDVRQEFQDIIDSSFNKQTDLSLVGLTQYSTGIVYAPGTTTIYNGILYQCTTQTQGTFNPSNWTVIANSNGNYIPLSGNTSANQVSGTILFDGGTGIQFDGGPGGITGDAGDLTLIGELTQFTLSEGDTTFTDFTPTPVGIMYGSDYSTTLEPLSLIHKSFADGRYIKNTGAISAITVSANTFYSGSTDLSNLFESQNNFNSFSALTNSQLNTKANLSGATFTGAISAITVSANTFYSGSTDLSNLFESQSSFNSYSAGTNSSINAQLNTKANLSGGTFTGAVSGTSISANTLFSGSTNLSNLFLPVSNPLYTGILQTGTLTYSDTGILEALESSTNSYNQLIIQNANSGATASSDIVVNNNLSTASSFYGDFGINSSSFSGNGNFNKSNAVYLSSTNGDLTIGTTTNNNIHFVVAGGVNDSMVILSGGTVGINTSGTTAQLAIQPGSTSTVGQIIKANTGQSGDLFQTLDTNSNKLLYINSGGTLNVTNISSNASYLTINTATTNTSPIIIGSTGSTIQAPYLGNNGVGTVMASDNIGNITASYQTASLEISNGTIQGYLSTTGNWTLGVYGGTAITNTYQGQFYYDTTYMYYFVADNTPIRLARV